MKKTTIQTQTKATVEVVIPKIKLTVADLVYMTGLISGGTRCNSSNKVTDKLSFLGLIEYREIQPCATSVAKWKSDVQEWQKKIRLAVREKRWGDISAMDYRMRRAPVATKDYTLTKSGIEFLSKGRAQSITSVKGSCV